MEGTVDIADTVEVEAAADDDLVISDTPMVMGATETQMESPDHNPTGDTEPKDENNEHKGNVLNGDIDMNPEDQLLDEAELQLALESDSRSITSLKKPRLRPIEVVLTPPSNLEDYEILSPSFVVDKVLEEVRMGDGSWFSVEYSDGRIEQVSVWTMLRFSCYALHQLPLLLHYFKRPLLVAVMYVHDGGEKLVCFVGHINTWSSLA